MSTTKKRALVSEARAEVERAAHGTPPVHAARIRAGESDDNRLRLLVQLADALELSIEADEAAAVVAPQEHREIPDFPTRMERFHQSYPGMTDLWHTSCVEHAEYGVCAEHEVADRSIRAHLTDEHMDLVVARGNAVLARCRNDALVEYTIPELVGYAEIASMAGVSRQRARQFASLEGFPTPAVETSYGPLRLKTEVQSWLDTRNTRPGRPKTKTDPPANRPA